MFFLKRTHFIVVILVMIVCFDMVYAKEESLLLYDDFSDGSLLNPPRSIENPRWRAKYWTVPQPVDDGTGNMILRLDNVSIETDKLTETKWENFEVEVKFRFLLENKDKFYSMGIRLLDEKKETVSYNLLLETQYGLFYQCRTPGGEKEIPTSIRLGAESAEVFTGDWQTFKIKVLGNRVTAFLDGDEVANSTTRVTSDGYSGIGLHNDRKDTGQAKSFVEVDYIKVIDLH